MSSPLNPLRAESVGTRPVATRMSELRLGEWCGVAHRVQNGAMDGWEWALDATDRIVLERMVASGAALLAQARSPKAWTLLARLPRPPLTPLERHAAVLRRRELAAVPSPVDHGATGPAQQVRPSRLVETIAAGVVQRQMQDTHPIQHWDCGALLTERQVEAAWRITRTYELGFPARAVTASYGQARGGEADEMTELRKGTARNLYGFWMQHVPAEARHCVARMVRGEYPAPMGGLGCVRRATTVLANVMGLPK